MMSNAEQSLDLGSVYMRRPSEFQGENNAHVPSEAASAGPPADSPGVGEAKPDAVDAPEEALSAPEPGSAHNRLMTLGGDDAGDENARSREEQV